MAVVPGPVAGSAIGGQPSPYDLAQAAAARLTTGPGGIIPPRPNVGGGQSIATPPAAISHYGPQASVEPLHGGTPRFFGAGEGQAPTPPIAPPPVGGQHEFPPGFPPVNVGPTPFPPGSRGIPGGETVNPLQALLQQAALRRLGAVPNG